jgi:hypothetical protein
MVHYVKHDSATNATISSGPLGLTLAVNTPTPTNPSLCGVHSITQNTGHDPIVFPTGGCVTLPSAFRGLKFERIAYRLALEPEPSPKCAHFPRLYLHDSTGFQEFKDRQSPRENPEPNRGLTGLSTIVLTMDSMDPGCAQESLILGELAVQ